MPDDYESTDVCYDTSSSEEAVVDSYLGRYRNSHWQTRELDHAQALETDVLHADLEVENRQTDTSQKKRQ